MAFIPKDAIWYIAQIVLEITVQDDPQNVVHVNHMLIKATSPEEAYRKALRLGAEHESSYSNAEGKAVQIIFRGLHNLSVVYENLEDGAEVLYEERVGLTPQEVDTLVQPRELLGLFKPIEKSPGPDYASASIQQEARRMVEHRGTRKKRNCSH